MSNKVYFSGQFAGTSESIFISYLKPSQKFIIMQEKGISCNKFKEEKP